MVIMSNCKLKFTAPFLLVLLFSCNQQKIKIVREKFHNGTPEIVDYFDTEADARQDVDVQVKDGLGYANKAISFDEERYYENGVLQSKGRYIKGLTCGLWQYFYDTGIRQGKCYYINGRETDTICCWYPTGILKRSMVEIDTVKNYWHIVDYFENGHKSSENYLLNNSIDNWTVEGPYKEWHKNDHLKLEAIFKNNSSVGTWREWDDKGVLIKESDVPFTETFSY
jgi:antitoxin component YwqK of YwqJK toxin-antitoxin module